jgi:hypothetical protein
MIPSIEELNDEGWDVSERKQDKTIHQSFENRKQNCPWRAIVIEHVTEETILWVSKNVNKEYNDLFRVAFLVKEFYCSYETYSLSLALIMYNDLLKQL